MPQPLRFHCAACHTDCTSQWTEEDAEAEFEAKFPDQDSEDVAVVCDRCYRAFGLCTN